MEGREGWGKEGERIRNTLFDTGEGRGGGGGGGVERGERERDRLRNWSK